MKILSEKGIASLQALHEDLNKQYPHEEKEGSYMHEVYEAALKITGLMLEHNDVGYWLEASNRQQGQSLIMQMVHHPYEYTSDIFNQTSYRFAKLVSNYLENMLNEGDELTYFVGILFSAFGSSKYLDITLNEFKHKIHLYDIIHKIKFNKAQHEQWMQALEEFKNKMETLLTPGESPTDFATIKEAYTQGVKNLNERLNDFPFVIFPHHKEQLTSPLGASVMLPSPLRSKMRASLLNEEKRLNVTLKSLGSTQTLNVVYEESKSLFAPEEKNTNVTKLLNRVNQFKIRILQYVTGAHFKRTSFFSMFKSTMSEVDEDKMHMLNFLINSIHSVMGVAGNFCIKEQAKRAVPNIHIEVEACQRLETQPSWLVPALIFQLFLQALNKNNELAITKSCPSAMLTEILQEEAQAFLKLAISVSDERLDISMKELLKAYELICFGETEKELISAPALMRC